jgi:hypothetical protein
MANGQQDPTASYTMLEQIRRRPGMYIGDVGSRGLHNMLFSLVADSLAESAEGFGHSLTVSGRHSSYRLPRCRNSLTQLLHSAEKRQQHPRTEGG